MEKTLHIESKNRNICDVINHHYLYVPVNQRPFSWKKENIKALLRDIKLAIENKDVHFIGTIACRLNNDKNQAISLKTRNKNETKNQYELIDGQQRITTIWLFSYAAMNFLKEKRNKFYKEIEKKLYDEENKELIKNSWLMLSGIDEESFCDLRDRYIDYVDDTEKLVNGIKDEVKKSKKEKGQNSILKLSFLDCFEIFKELKFSEKDVIKIWKYIFVDKNVQFTFTVFENLSLAKTFEMFSNINTKGMQLSELDSIKNEIFQYIKQNEYEEYSSKWFQFLSETKGNPEDYLCMYLRANSDNEYIWKKLTYKTFVKILKKKGNFNSYCKRLIDDLLKDVKIYNSMFSYNKIDVIPDLKKIDKDKKFYYEIFRRGNYDYAKPIVYIAIKNKDYSAIINIVSFYFIVKTLGFAGASFMQKSMLEIKKRMYNHQKYKKLSKTFYGKKLKLLNNLTKDKAIKKFESDYSDNKYKNIMTKPILAYYQSCFNSPNWSYYNVLMNSENYMYFDKDHICPKEPKKNGKFEYYCENNGSKKVIKFKQKNTFGETKEMNAKDFYKLYLNNLGNLRIYDKSDNIKKRNKSEVVNFYGWKSIKKRRNEIAEFIVSSFFDNIS